MSSIEIKRISPDEMIREIETSVKLLRENKYAFRLVMDCVTHSLALTNHGLFEVGRYPGVNLASQNRCWQWFLHRRWATPAEVAEIQEMYQWSFQQFLEHAYQGIIGGIPKD